MVDPSPNRATMLVLAYLWPLAIVPLLVSKEDTEVQWHAKHGLVLMAAELVAVLALSVLAGVMTMMAFGIGLALSVLLYILLWATILIIHVLAMIKALGGTRLEIPAISHYAARF
jgi:uncharacterized membrane protein